MHAADHIAFPDRAAYTRYNMEEKIEFDFERSLDAPAPASAVAVVPPSSGHVSAVTARLVTAATPPPLLPRT